MDYSKDRNSNNVNRRDEQVTNQPKKTQEKETGYGDKKLEGPNRPSV
jgi:hypothetical protein